MIRQYLNLHFLTVNTRGLGLGLFLLLTSVVGQASAQDLTMENLLDRIKIEDLLTRYYFDLSAGKSHELSEYFTSDALLDVDGTIAKGHGEIAKLYQGPESDEKEEVEPRQAEDYRRGHMLLSNPIIEVMGDRATAHVIWTGVMNEGVGKAPSLYEQGREFTELVKVDGKWLIKTRYISSDSGLPDRFDATYEPREHR